MTHRSHIVRDEHGQDCGLQPERTSLAWQRTSIAIVAACIAFLRLAELRASVTAAVAGTFALAVGASVLFRSISAYRTYLHLIGMGLPLPSTSRPLWLCAATALLGIAGLLLGLV